MTRKISGHDGDLVVNGDVELDGQITGRLVVEPGGSVVIHGAVVGSTPTVGDGSVADSDGPQPGHAAPGRHEIDSVVSDIP